MKHESLLKKAVSATGICIRVLMGAGALALLSLGVKSKPWKKTKDIGRSR